MWSFTSVYSNVNSESGPLDECLAACSDRAATKRDNFFVSINTSLAMYASHSLTMVARWSEFVHVCKTEKDKKDDRVSKVARSRTMPWESGYTGIDPAYDTHLAKSERLLKALGQLLYLH